VSAPLGLDAALQVLADRERRGTERLNQMELALKQTRYEASRAERQCKAVAPLCVVRKKYVFLREIAPLMAIWHHISWCVFLDLSPPPTSWRLSNVPLIIHRVDGSWDRVSV
jgi:hypothetical protein